MRNWIINFVHQKPFEPLTLRPADDGEMEVLVARTLNVGFAYGGKCSGWCACVSSSTRSCFNCSPDIRSAANRVDISSASRA